MLLLFRGQGGPEFDRWISGGPDGDGDPPSWDTGGAVREVSTMKRLLLSVILAAPLFAQAPVLLFTDLASGPATGNSDNSQSGQVAGQDGAIVTVCGERTSARHQLPPQLGVKWPGSTRGATPRDRRISTPGTKCKWLSSRSRTGCLMEPRRSRQPWAESPATPCHSRCAQAVFTMSRPQGTI